MKTKSLLLGLLATFGVATANAGTKVMYQQNFETASTVDETGWSCQAGTLSIASDYFGQYLSFALGNNNGRSAQVTWGSEIYGETAPTTYTFAFDFNMATGPNNQYSSNIAVFTDQAPKANTAYGATYDNFIFDIQQTTDAATWYLNKDAANTLTLTAGTWYTVTLDVNVETRTVDYSIVTSAGEGLTSGSYTVPEGVSMYAEGLFNLASRYSSVYQFDNIKISTQVDGDYANVPTVALTRVGKDADSNESLNLRAYTITFGDEETLHVIGTDGTEIEYSYADCDGAYTYETTTSGTLTAWTTSGEATSDKVETAVDCSPCALPAAVATITSVKEGFAKTYTVTIDNSKTPLAPQIFYTYTFTPKGGTASEVSEEKSTGSTIDVEEEGTLTITTKAFGYQSTTSTVENNVEYTLANKYDFVNMSESDILALGFEKEDNLVATSTSGEGNWTARAGMWYWDTDYAKAEDGTETGTKVYPFGHPVADAEGNTTYDGDGIVRYKLLSTKLAECYNTMFPGLEMWQNFNMQWKKSIGIVLNTMKQGDSEDGSSLAKAGTVNVKINNLADGNIVVVKKIDNYGRNMAHPVCKDASEYNLYDLAELTEVYNSSSSEWTVAEDGSISVTFTLYRIQTALAGIEIYAAKNGGTGIQGITSDKVAVEDANAPYYTISGMKVAKPTQKGIYIHNGKKIIIK